MVLAASGEPLSVGNSLLDPHGHAIEVRVNAENPIAGFRPTPGPILRHRPPGGIGVRVDSGVYQGYSIPQDYDSLMSKVISWAPDREAARRRMLRALQEYEIAGPSSTVPFAAAVLAHPVFVAGEVGTTFVERHLGELEAAVQAEAAPDPDPDIPQSEGVDREEARTFEVEVNRRMFRVRVAELRPSRAEAAARPRRAARGVSAPQGNVLMSPMHGTVISLKKSPGDPVQEGDTVVIIEAMKMENEVAAQRAGTVASLAVSVGDTVEADQPLAVIN
jgi:acetyl-CoA/propionyl-CoA carboxylase biotin carboxyl carrier protein